MIKKTLGITFLKSRFLCSAPVMVSLNRDSSFSEWKLLELEVYYHSVMPLESTKCSKPISYIESKASTWSLSPMGPDSPLWLLEV